MGSKYGEPWATELDLKDWAKGEITSVWVKDKAGNRIAGGIESPHPRLADEDFADRIRDCVNALQGIDNPRAFVEAAVHVLGREAPHRCGSRAPNTGDN